jgi:hypothetical protein
MMQPSCPGTSLVKRAGFAVMTLRQSNSHPNGKSKVTKAEKGNTDEKQSQEYAHNVFDTKGIIHNEFILAGQTYNSDILQRL